jgi:hypothetical protein
MNEIPESRHAALRLSEITKMGDLHGLLSRPRGYFPEQSTWSLTSGLVAALIIAGAGYSQAGDDTKPEHGREEATRPRIYDRDPDHPWNRLHAALFVRIGPDGKAYGHDRLEPLLWRVL